MDFVNLFDRDEYYFKKHYCEEFNRDRNNVACPTCGTISDFLVVKGDNRWGPFEKIVCDGRTHDYVKSEAACTAGHRFYLWFYGKCEACSDKREPEVENAIAITATDSKESFAAAIHAPREKTIKEK